LCVRTALALSGRGESLKPAGRGSRQKGQAQRKVVLGAFVESRRFLVVSLVIVEALLVYWLYTL
jgi:hypothetical protein